MLEETRKALWNCILRDMKLELEGSTEKLYDGFINGLLNLFEYWICHFKASNPDLIPPFSNEVGPEVLLQQYMHTADNPIFEYIKTKKRSIINDKIIPRLPRISYINNTKKRNTGSTTIIARTATTTIQQQKKKDKREYKREQHKTWGKQQQGLKWNEDK